MKNLIKESKKNQEAADRSKLDFALVFDKIQSEVKKVDTMLDQSEIKKATIKTLPIDSMMAI